MIYITEKRHGKRMMKHTDTDKERERERETSRFLTWVKFGTMGWDHQRKKKGKKRSKLKFYHLQLGVYKCELVNINTTSLMV